MIDWILGNDAALWWLVLSAIAFVVTLFAVPLILIWIPDDYFLKERRDRPKLIKRHPLSVLLVVLRNLLGCAFILAGMVMLALPGQGMLTIFVGALLVNFPGRDKTIRWLLSRGRIHHMVDRLRAWGGRGPLIVHVPHRHKSEDLG